MNSPSVNPANLGLLTGAFRHIFGKLMQDIDGVQPAMVIAYDRNSKRAQVQPLILTVGTSGEKVQKAQIASVPPLQIGAGGFVLNFNIKPGDLGWIIACDRDITLFLQNRKMSIPNSNRVKDFADSWFIPHVLSQYITDEEDAENAVLQSLDATVKISLGTNKIKIKAPNLEIETETATITAESIAITASAAFEITTPTLAVTGDITATGDITPHV
jgi:hypothetical protein